MNSVQSVSPNPPMLGFQESIVRCLRKYATFRGRATRAEYWWFALFNTLLGLLVYAAFQHCWQCPRFPTRTGPYR